MIGEQLLVEQADLAQERRSDEHAGAAGIGDVADDELGGGGGIVPAHRLAAGVAEAEKMDLVAVAVEQIGAGMQHQPALDDAGRRIGFHHPDGLLQKAGDRFGVGIQEIDVLVAVRDRPPHGLIVAAGESEIFLVVEKNRRKAVGGGRAVGRQQFSADQLGRAVGRIVVDDHEPSRAFRDESLLDGPKALGQEPPVIPRHDNDRRPVIGISVHANLRSNPSGPAPGRSGSPNRKT